MVEEILASFTEFPDKLREVRLNELKSAFPNNKYVFTYFDYERKELQDLLKELHKKENLLQEKELKQWEAPGENIVLEELKKVGSELNKLRKDFAGLEIRRLSKELDCWHSNARTRMEDDLFKSSLIEFYNRSDPNNANNIICMLTNQSYLKKHVRGSHILKKCTDGDLM